MKRFLLFALIVVASMAVGYLIGNQLGGKQVAEYLSPLGELGQQQERIYQPFTIESLREYPFLPRQISIAKEIQDYPDYTAYEFTYAPLGKKMSGQLNLPKEMPANPKAIVLVRGWAPLETYYTGMGTKNAAAVFAQNGYITLSPDFFGYGNSDPEPNDHWLARFEKPIVVIELIESIRQLGVLLEPQSQVRTPIASIGMWAHSNGGQITLTSLEILGKPIPATLWAPVTAPFPYSVIFFSNEDYDEGKAFRKDVAAFEQTYDVFDFSLTQHLDLLHGPFQLHHGQRDTAAPYWWSDSFINLVKNENERRQELTDRLKAAEDTNNATEAAQIRTEIAGQNLEPIEFEYFTYPNADHNLVPDWNTAISRDLEFFAEKL
jgi:cephalosporin-C deacetylase-like acetyl esterase